MKTKNNKIVFITTVPETIYFTLEEQIPFLIEKGYKVSTICAKGSWITHKNIEQKYGITTAYWVQFKRVVSLFQDFFCLLHITSLLFVLRPDIIHASTPKASLLSLIGGTIARVPLRIYHVRGIVYQNSTGVKKAFWHLLEMFLCHISHVVIVNSESNRDYLISNKLCKSSKLKILGYGSSHGIDYNFKFNPANYSESMKNELRQKLHIPLNSVVFGFVGRMVKDKGITDLAAAWQIFTREQVNAQLILAGQTSEPRDILPEDCLQYLKSTPTVHICNDAINARKYFSIFDVFVLPSHREGFPNVVLEASAMEIPVITTNALGCIDSVIDGVTGFIYNTGNYQDLALLLNKLYTQQKLRKTLGKQAREHIIKHYNPELICKDLYLLISNYTISAK